MSCITGNIQDYGVTFFFGMLLCKAWVEFFTRQPSICPVLILKLQFYGTKRHLQYPQLWVRNSSS